MTRTKPVEWRVDEHGCHLCTSHGSEREHPRATQGYLLVRLARYLWEQAHGPVPPGRIVRYCPRSRACINPAHVRIGTRAECARSITRRGEAHAQAKLTDADVRDMRESEAPGEELAARYGVSRDYVAAVRAGRVRKEAGGPLYEYEPPLLYGWQLRERRLAARLFQREAAERMGCSQSHVSKIEASRCVWDRAQEAAYLAALEGTTSG